MGHFRTKFKSMIKNKYLYMAWAISFISTIGSLFLSQFMNLPPCNLCWYQRILMFPLVIILGVGYSLEDRNINLYSVPFVLLGLVISIYHNLLYYKWITPAITPCSSGVSCTERQLELFGFLSIPLMSLMSFLILLICLLLHQNILKKEKQSNEK